QAPVAAAHTAAAPRAVQWQQGVYLWDSHALLDEQRRAQLRQCLGAALFVEQCVAVPEIDALLPLHRPGSRR
ncbi:hypothetical protein, partial [Aeromonas caviae]|uniref:hypothetical protein n=1 Tax=Aeromonas caviae TaxID=648 RepID=UPI001CC75377